MRHSLLSCAALALVLALIIGTSTADEGQGEADPDSKVSGLDFGTYWYGAPLSKGDLYGKVVLVEIWGS